MENIVVGNIAPIDASKLRINAASAVLAGPSEEKFEFMKDKPVGIDAVLTERGLRYGKFIDKADSIQRLKEIMRGTPNWSSLAPDQKEALEMLATKVGRILHGDPNFHDSWHDIEGYVKLVSDRLLDGTEQ